MSILFNAVYANIIDKSSALEVLNGVMFMVSNEEQNANAAVKSVTFSVLKLPPWKRSIDVSPEQAKNIYAISVPWKCRFSQPSMMVRLES